MATKKTSMERLLERLEDLLPPTLPENMRQGCYRWQHTALGVGHLAALPGWRAPDLRQLWGLEDEIGELRANTAAFMAGKPANHAVLTGPRGCGKTTIIAGIAGEFIAKGLLCIQIDRDHFSELAVLTAALEGRSGKFLVICNELSFSGDTPGLLAAKAALDDLSACGAQLLVYATSNRRHLTPEQMEENLAAVHEPSGEINPGETTEEKVSLADRFGLWIPVINPDDEQYCEMVQSQLQHLGAKKATAAELKEALRWAEERGSQNGRIASQFVRHLSQKR